MVIKLILILFLLSVSVVFANEADQTREVLIDLFKSTNGTNWRKNDGWLSTSSVCQWYGVYCDSNEVVTSLQLNKNMLAGTIPSSFGRLIRLQYVDLGSNQLTGSIPTSISQLRHVQWLYLDGNQLTFEIPDVLGQMANLRLLDLHNNRLTGPIPNSIGKLAQLERLFLAQNQLSNEIPTSISKLQGLEYLSLASNALSGSIPSLETLRRLQLLLLSNNHLQHVNPNMTLPTGVHICSLVSNDFICPIPDWAVKNCFATCK